MPIDHATEHRTDAVNIEDYSKFLLHSPTEIVYLLRSLMSKKCLLTAHFNGGKDMLLTSIIGVDNAAGVVYLDTNANEAVNQAICASHHIIFATRQDRIRIQFAANAAQKVPYQQGHALRIAMPQTLLKLQRRDYYRVETPRGKPLAITLNHPQLGHLQGTLLDISVGGAGLTNLPAEVEFSAGLIFHNCRLVLPEIGPIISDMELRNMFDLVLRNGARTKRYGFQFIELPANSQAMIQRYINKLERERRALLAEHGH